MTTILYIRPLRKSSSIEILNIVKNHQHVQILNHTLYILFCTIITLGINVYLLINYFLKILFVTEPCLSKIKKYCRNLNSRDNDLAFSFYIDVASFH